ncbi:mannose-6-phosphate isomerase [Parvularcula flava]|uniref:Mannose-6-phosphate isomerase n=1 Tax=Aquisalinus luteolus TaxID=1566827 RepID=A0A8J3A6U2_9PROT|nr:AGE family epimerase/isomerase [Aquisalinus luteolus]NHK29533.1 mannose-6-phosphate isomerase [Aquisalinus luteolus]GGI01652.1 mannose-6-phosphate isomerase [Aquisalinus luteolus]
MTGFSSTADRFVAWVRDDALPFWADHAVDAAGGFYEKLDLEGRPVTDCLRRVRVQARQTYSYAYAASLGWYGDARRVSDHGWAFVTSRGMQRDGTPLPGASIAHLLNNDGSLHDGHRDTYAQAFLLLAAAWRLRSFGDDSAAQVIRDSFAYLDTIRTPHGGYQEADTPALPRRQNPHMHLFEAFMACFEATNDPACLERAGEIHALFTDKFYDDRHGVLLEFFNEDWSPHAETGDLIEPGHLMEWVWLLRWYERLTGTNVSAPADAMYQNAIKLGLNEKTGLLYDELRLDGTVTKPTARSWSTTEYIKASLAQAEAGQHGMFEVAAEKTALLLDTYLSPPLAGGWYDQYDANGNVVGSYMETSTFYHLVCAAGETDRVKAVLA